MTTYFLSVTNGVPPYGPVATAGVAEGTSTVAAAAINVELNTTICPTLSRQDAIAMLQAVENYIRADGNLASPVLTLFP